MELNGKVAVITGGGQGIGRSVARAFAAKGAKVMVSDLSAENAGKVADEIGGLAQACNVRDEAAINELVKRTTSDLGPIDLFYSNAGIAFGEDAHSASASNDVWQTCWEIHVMSHVYAARAVLPSMIERGSGYLLQMASAAGLLSQIGDAAYSTTKHAAVGFAESLAINHGDDGIKVSVVCPQYVATPMLGYNDGEDKQRNPGTLSPEQAADTILKGVEQDRFLILPHEDVHTFIQHKAADTGRWITGMQRLRRDILDKLGATDLKSLHKLL